MKRLKGTAQGAIARDDAHVERLDSTDTGPRIGQWYWLKEGDEEEVLACALHVGSNYVELHTPTDSYSRVHFKDFWASCRHEPNAREHIHARIREHQGEAQALLGQVQELYARLGMVQATPSAASEQGALVVLSGTTDIKKYERALIKAKNEEFPALFEKIEAANKNLAVWMKAEVLPLRAHVNQSKASIETIDDRIFSISLYAGLTEECVRCHNGKPAAADAKLHVMQRMLYMDEESLLGYKHGGMEFKDIKEFDKFLCEPENRDRILPFPRTLVAMRVRRSKKEREGDGTLTTAFINFRMEHADKATFLYIRNGNQVWRLSCDMDFGELIFPDKSVHDPREAKMIHVRWHNDVRSMSAHEWEERIAARKAAERASKAWARKNPDKSWVHNPHRTDYGCYDLESYVPFNSDTVYYDDGLAAIEKQIKEYNRVAVIIQGLYDRSMVLHPHPQVKSWTEEGFNAAIELVNDGTNALNYGEPPDFEAYRQACNASLRAGSITVGQNDYWQRLEARKECARLERDYRNRSGWWPVRYQPYGNPGPTDPGPAVRASATMGAAFKWERQRQTHTSYSNPRSETLPCSLVVPAGELLNVSAYKLGDFKRFYRDPRTRAQYLRWAPLLLDAEEYVAKHGEGTDAAERALRTLWPF